MSSLDWCESTKKRSNERFFQALTNMTNTAVNGVEDFVVISPPKCFASVPKLLARTLKLLTSANFNLPLYHSKGLAALEVLGKARCRRISVHVFTFMLMLSVMRYFGGL